MLSGSGHGRGPAAETLLSPYLTDVLFYLVSRWFMLSLQSICDPTPKNNSVFRTLE